MPSFTPVGTLFAESAVIFRDSCGFIRQTSEITLKAAVSINHSLTSQLLLTFCFALPRAQYLSFLLERYSSLGNKTTPYADCSQDQLSNSESASLNDCLCTFDSQTIKGNCFNRDIYKDTEESKR